MLSTSFKNYDEFKELFVAENGSGKSRRKNGVLLSFIKSKEMRSALKDYNISLDSMTNMSRLYEFVTHALHKESVCNACNSGSEAKYCVRIMGVEYYSDTYETDGREGVCVDGDFSGYRYINRQRDGRVYKMKIGKMYRHLIDLLEFGRSIPEPVKLWVCEEMTRRWEAYAKSKVPSNNLVLHVDDDFGAIYDRGGRCRGNFHSCMAGGCNYYFYEKSVKAKAAYLTETPEGEEPGDDDTIVARCVLFTEVTREDTGEVIRVAERQYSSDGEETLQRILIQKLLDGGYIDAYKKTGAGCGDANAFLDKNGTDMSEVKMHIDCDLHSGDHLSYQDSFKWYDEDDEVAYNYYNRNYTESIDSTDDYFDEEEGNWDSWHEEYTDSDLVTVFYRGSEYECDEYRLDDFVRCDAGRYEDEYVYNEDVEYCVDIDGYVEEDDATYSELLEEYYYDEDEMEEAEEDYKKDNWYYSEVTEEYYETERERDDAEQEYKEENWTYSDFDDEYFEDDSDVVEWLCAYDRPSGEFRKQSISYDSICELIENGLAVEDEHSGVYYATLALEEATVEAA